MADDFDPDAYIRDFDPDAYLSGQTEEAPTQTAASEPFDPDTYIKNFDPDKYLAGQEPEPEGHIAADVREVAHGVVPAAAGVAGAAGATTLAAPVIAGATAINPVLGAAAALGFGAAGMLGGAYLGEKVQDKALKTAGYDDDVIRAANRKARPIETQVAGMVPFVGNPAATVGQRVAGGAVMGAFSGGQQLARGEFDPTAIAVDTAFGAAMPNGNRFTRAIHSGVEGAVAPYAPGRPDTQARPTAGAEKADADTSQSPSVAGNNALAQQAAAPPKAPVGQENSKAVGPENYSKQKIAIENSPFAAEPVDNGFSQGDVTSNKTTMAALAPEPEPPVEQGQIINTGIVEAAAQQRPQAPPAPDLRKQQAAQMNAEILKQYPTGRMPSDVRERFNANAQLLRGRPQATLAPEPPKIVGSPDGTGEVPLSPKVTNTMPEAQPTRATPSSVQRETGLGYVKAAEEADRRNAAALAEETYTPEQQQARLAAIEARQAAPKATLAPEPAAEAPIVAKTKDGLARQTAKAQADMIEKLRAAGKNELADRYEALSPEERQAVHADLANGLRDRESKAGSLRNKLGAETKNAAQRDQHNSAIDAVQKAFEAHPPKDNETAADLSERLRAAVHTAHEAHGSNPLSRKGGYLPRALPESFQWLRMVQANALRAPAYWTDAKLAEFKAAEEDLRSKLDKSEYPTKNPELMDRGIEMNRRGGGDVAEALAEKRGVEGHEDEVLERASLVRAAETAGELGQYFRGEVDHENLSPKARKTLDDMPKDVRKAAFEAGEDGADPAHSTKVQDWYRDYFGDPEKKFGETHEGETDTKPRMTPVTDKAALDKLKPKAKLIDATTPEGEAEIAAVFDKGKEKKPKYDFPGKEIKGTQVDPAEQARLLAEFEKANKRAESRAAPKKSYIQGEKYKDEVTDLTGRLVQSAKLLGRDERGGVKFDKIEQAVKGLIAKLRKDASTPGKKGDVYNSALEVGPHLTSYIAKAPYSAENNAGRRVADRMNIVAKTDNVIRVTALQEQAAINDALRPQTRGEKFKEKAANKARQIAGKDIEVAPDLASARDKSRQMYDALESKDADKIKDDATRELFETQVLPKQLETEFIRATIREQFPEANIGRETEDGVHRIAINGGARDAVETIGANADPVAGNNPLSTARKSPMMERPFVVLEGVKSGQRTVIHMADDGAGKFTGDFTAWVGHKPVNVEAPKLDFKLGEIYEMGGRKFRMRDATTDEIEANALGSDGKPMQYKRDIAASVISANAYHRQLLNHLQAIKDLKEAPEFKDFATTSHDDPKVRSGEWVKLETPGFEKYWGDKHLRDALRDAYQPGINDDALNVARNISRAITRTIFWNPIVHQLNVGYHWVVERGFKWVPGSGGYRDLAETGAMAIKSVIKQDKIQQVLAENGAGNIYGGVYSDQAHQKLGLAIGEMMAKEPNKWGAVARTLDMSVGDLIRSVYRASSKAMWSVNDMLLTQAILSDLKHFGKTVDTASKAEIRESINRVERHIPNYRLPARVMGSGEGGRFIAAKMGDPLYIAFGRYHYGVFNSFANIAKNLTKGSGADRKEAIGQLMTLAVLAYGVWPYIYNPIAQAVTGNEHASVRGRGPMGPISHAREMKETGDYGALYREIVSFSPVISTAMDIYRNKDFAGNPILDRKDLSEALHGSPKAAGRTAAQAAGYAAGTAISPLGTLNSSLNNKNQGVAAGLRDQIMDIKNPSPGSKRWIDTQARSQQRDHLKRIKKEPNLGDKLLGLIGSE